MRVAVLGDLHLVCEKDPYIEAHQKRAFFKDAWPTCKQLCKLVRKERPDLVVSLGDMVDWYSDENRDFALEMLSEMEVPWVVTPGNHDFASYRYETSGIVGPLQTEDVWAQSRIGWEEKGIELGNRALDAGNCKLILLESAASTVPDGTEGWLAAALREDGRNLVFTHVPLNVPSVAEYILSVDPRRDLRKYVQSGAPALFDRSLRNRVAAVFSAHLHFSGHLQVAGTDMYMLPLSITAQNRPFADQGRVTFLDLSKNEVEHRQVA